MKTFLVSLGLLSGTIACSQDLSVHLNNGQTNTYGISTVSKITHSNTNMEIHRVGGTVDNISLTSIDYFKYNFISSSIVEKGTGEEALKLYPNPNNGTFRLQFKAEESSAYTLRIVNLSGAELYQTTGRSVEGTNNLNVNIPELYTGIYFAELFNGSKKQIEKIIIK